MTERILMSVSEDVRSTGGKALDDMIHNMKHGGTHCELVRITEKQIKADLETVIF